MKLFRINECNEIVDFTDSIIFKVLGRSFITNEKVFIICYESSNFTTTRSKS